MEFVGVARYLVYDNLDRTWAMHIPGGLDWILSIDMADRFNRVQAEAVQLRSVDGVIILAPECAPIRSRYAYDGDRRQMVMRTDWEPTLAPKTDPELPEKNDEEVRTANV